MNAQLHDNPSAQFFALFAISMVKYPAFSVPMIEPAARGWGHGSG